MFKLFKLVREYQESRDANDGELLIENKARQVARQWVAKPDNAYLFDRQERDVLDEALETAFLSWGYRR